MYKFNQNDSTWANVVYSAKAPHTETVKSSGCGICSACMIVSNLTDTYIEPPESTAAKTQETITKSNSLP